MNKAARLLLLLGVLGVGFVAGSWHRPQESVNAAAAPRPVRYYVDPMHPAYKSDHPGIAPDCGMPLQAVYDDDAGAIHADHSEAPGTVHVNAQQQQLIGVRVALVDSVARNQRLRLYGRVAADESRIYRINIGADGVVRDASSVTTGSLVEKDAWLATVSTADARGPIQGYLVALDVLERAKKSAEAATAVDLANAVLQQTIDRLLTLGMSSAHIDEIAKTRQVPAAIRIGAPETGFVISRNVSVGQRLQRGDELYRLADLRRVWIMADVFGADAERVRPGAAAEISVPGRGRTLHAHVSTTVLPQFNASTQTVTVRLDVDNAGFVLRPDMFVDVDLILTTAPTIAIPADAMIDSGLTRWVFVEREANVFEPRPIEIGWRFGAQVEVVKGLNAGERIAIAGAFLLDAESRIRGTVSRAGSRP